MSDPVKKKTEESPITLKAHIKQEREALFKEINEACARRGFRLEISPDILINGQRPQVILIPV